MFSTCEISDSWRTFFVVYTHFCDVYAQSTVKGVSLLPSDLKMAGGGGAHPFQTPPYIKPMLQEFQKTCSNGRKNG